MQLLVDELQEASVRPIVRPGKWFNLVAGILGLVVVAGIVAYFIGKPNLNDSVFWGLGIANFVTLIGISCGGAIVTAFLRVTKARWGAPMNRIAEAMAVVALIAGMLALTSDLGHPLGLWRMFVSANPLSPIVWDTTVISLYFVVSIILFYLPLIPDMGILRSRLSQATMGWRAKLYSVLSLGWKGSPQQQKRISREMTIMAILAVPMVVIVHSVLGWAFAVTLREGWHSTIFGPYFVSAALFSGVAADILVVIALRKAYHLEKFISEQLIHKLGYMMMALGLVYLYFTFAELLTSGWAQPATTTPLIESLLVGYYSPLFWYFVIGSGIIPVLLVLIPKTRNAVGLSVASGLVVLGLWIKRVLIVVAPLGVGLYPGSTATQLSYFPSWSEITITLAAFAFIPLALMIIFRIFPVMSIYEVTEAATESEDRQLSPVASIKTEQIDEAQ